MSARSVRDVARAIRDAGDEDAATELLSTYVEQARAAAVADLTWLSCGDNRLGQPVYRLVGPLTVCEDVDEGDHATTPVTEGASA